MEKVVYINYANNFSESQLEEIKKVFTDFEIETEKRGMRGGATDLVAVVEIGLAFALVPYFSGLLSEAGKATWEAISNGIVGFSKKNCQTNDVNALIFYIEDKPIYAIERFHDAHEEFYLNSLPKALLKVNKFFKKIDIPEDTELMQIFQHPITKEWKYLFLPSTKSFGSYIDRIVDLDTFKFYKPTNHQDFIEHFCGDCNGNCCLVCAKYHLKRFTKKSFKNNKN